MESAKLQKMKALRYFDFEVFLRRKESAKTLKQNLNFLNPTIDKIFLYVQYHEESHLNKQPFILFKLHFILFGLSFILCSYAT